MVEENKELNPPKVLLVRKGEHQIHGTEKEAIEKAREGNICHKHLTRIFRAIGELKPGEKTSREIDPKIFVLICGVNLYAKLEYALANHKQQFEEGEVRIFIVDQNIPWSEKVPEEKTT
jgi:hypothetical protein